MGAYDLVFVAMDVGGAGGMERHAEQLLTRLLASGYRVAVIARTCEIPAHPGLSFWHVPVPRRPASLAYPAFMIGATLRSLRRGSATLHTTGALHLNRADLSTVHYCHRAAASRMTGSRASRPNWAFRLNSAVMGILSRAAEKWCYDPARTRVLCAVSSGVARELTETFPGMTGRVRTIPNGVDLAVFAPDPHARSIKRDQMGIANDALLALFVGGDWERKGLRHAVRALVEAPGWHLAVAGSGDDTSIAAEARSLGVSSRLHLLGPVSDTPALYAAADTFVLPTAYEAFPLVALEAAASALPLIITRVNGAEDLVEHGSNGWFVERDAHDIARRLRDLGGDPARLEAMGRGARVAASRFTWDEMALGYLSLYAELTGLARPSLARLSTETAARRSPASAAASASPGDTPA